MPANKKYLTKSPWIRLLKICIGTVGGYLVMLNFHLFLATIFSTKNLVVTSYITGYTLWAFLLLWAFTAKNIWRLGLYYTLLASFFYFIYFLLKL